MSKALFSSKPPGRRSGQQVFVLREDPQGSGDFFVLLVDSVHHDGLTLPGGSAEQNELPHLAARRHLETQTGLVLPLRTILTVDYSPAADLPEGIDFVYAGGVVTSRQAGAVRPHRPPQDVCALHWVPQAKLYRVMADDQHRRVEDAWDAWEHGASLPLLIRGVPVPVG
ncbi:NUDIX domain-containing protein [Kitasatospora sp. NPDC059577]|uniref:NUDIX domain-containing protein n=1 Tax=Kitasatospora sp. NPDC059577 TaxID=3346873 RepID=UPI0036CBAB6D